MGSRKYPPLTPKQIENILLSRGYNYFKSQGDHNFYICEVGGKKHVAQIDMRASEVQGHWLKLTIEQSGMTRKQFYCSTKQTAKKIGLKRVSRDKLLNWVEKPSLSD